MVAKGRDASDLFPSVVKNVVSKNIEVFQNQPDCAYSKMLCYLCSSLTEFYFFTQVKKLVYVYLVRYAEEQQDLALLSISTFQRGLKVCSPSFFYLFS